MPSENDFDSARKHAIKEHYLRVRDTQYQTTPGHARNVIGVGIGPKLQDTKAPGEKCVRLYVEKKIKPLEAVDAPFRIPVMLPGNVPTDVIETRRFISFDRDIAPGAGIGVDYNAPNVNTTLGGTLGAIVKVGDLWYALGSNHVMAVNGRIPVSKRILVKPSQKFIDNPGRHIFARLAVWVPLRPEGPRYDPDQPNHVDCALAVIENPHRVTGEFPGRVVNHAGIVDPAAGDEVIRVDDREEVKGTIEQASARVRIAYRFGTFDFEDVVLIKGHQGAFAGPGDSGALVVKDGKPCAMIIGGSQTYAIACKLSNVRDELRHELSNALPDHHDVVDTFELVLEGLEKHVQAIESSVETVCEKIFGYLKHRIRLV